LEVFWKGKEEKSFLENQSLKKRRRNNWCNRLKTRRNSQKVQKKRKVEKVVNITSGS
jgi:hypothetical protein